MHRFISLLLLLAHPGYCAAPSAPATLSLEQEKQAQHIFSMVRCVSCQGETVKESDALLSKAIRYAIREQLQQGQSEEQVIEFIRQRYGDYVILSPSVQANTLALWLLPCLILLLGVILIWRKKQCVKIQKLRSS